MRVLLVSLFHPAISAGGAQQACYNLFKGLQATMCEPIMLASVEPHMWPALFKPGATITGFEEHKNEFLFLSQGYDHTFHRNRDPRSLEEFEEFLHVTRPNVIHFHCFVTFGLEYFAAARRYLDKIGGRLIFTLHDFLAMCQAEAQMVRTFDKTLCEYASSFRCHQCFPDHAPEHFSMRTMWVKHHLDYVDVFISPSEFLRQRYVAWGIAPERIMVIPNGHVSPVGGRSLSTVPPPRSRNRFAFFGRLIENKGLLVLFDAIKLLRSRGLDFTVDIFGANLKHEATDQFRNAFNAFLKEEQRLYALQTPMVRFNGAYEMSDLDRLMQEIDWVVVPSTWWEIFGMVVSEAFLYGRPVICSNIGGLAERVRDNIDGLHFVVRSSRSLADVMKRAMSEDGLWEHLCHNIVPPPTAEDVARKHLEVYDGVSKLIHEGHSPCHHQQGRPAV